MRGLFLRVYAALVLVLLASVAAVALLMPPPEADLDHQVFGMAGVWPDEVAAQLGDPALDRQAVLAELEARLGSPVVLLPEEAVVGSLGDSARRALASGEPVVQIRDAGPAIYLPIIGMPMVAELRPGPPPPELFRGPRGIALALLLLLGLSGAVYLMVRPLESQLSAISATAERLGGGELGARVDIERQDAAGRLAGSFNSMAERVQTMVEGRKTLLHGVSHELRTPLARLRFALELIEMAPTAEDRTRRLQEAEGDIEELDGLVGELLQFSRLEGEGADGNKEPTSVEPLLSLLVEDGQRLRADVVVTFHFEGDLGVVDLDRKLFQRAIGNLVNNAVRYADGVVRLSAVRGPGRLQVCVDDDGPGVPEAMWEAIFDPFVRLDAARSRDTGGTGLGLAIASGCARVHRGTIQVSRSDLGGARFCWTMPLRS